MTPRAWKTVAAALFALFAVQLSASAAVAHSKADRVNVRSRPGFVGEIITQLKKGQEVTVLDTVTLRRPAPDEPPIWIKIELPADAPAWASADYVDIASGRVKADILNVRAGPSYDHGIVARAKQGTLLKILTPQQDGWVQVAAPEGSAGFVPAAWLAMGAGTGAGTTTGSGAAAASDLPRVAPAAGGTNAEPSTVAVPARTNAATVVVATRPAGSTNASPITVAKASPPAPVPTTTTTVQITTNAPQTHAVTVHRVTGNAWLEQFVNPPRGSNVAVTTTLPTATTAATPTATPTATVRTIDVTSTNVASPSGAQRLASEQESWNTPSDTSASTRVTVPSEPQTAVSETREDGVSEVEAVDPTPPVPLRVAPPGVIGEGRWVRREGVVVRPGNVMAPSFYALRTREGGTLMNFLITTQASPVSLKELRGKVVIVTGREYLDRRPLWRHIPLLDIETIEAVR